MAIQQQVAAARGRAGARRVERCDLLAEIDAELERGGIVIVRAPWGYGKSELLGAYARIVRCRTPSRPVIYVDFESTEVMAFMKGDREPLVRLLARRIKGRAAEEGTQAVQTADGLPVRSRRIPFRHTNDVTRLIYEFLAALAPAWCSRAERGLPPDAGRLEHMPLVIIDNMPGHAGDPMLEGCAAAFRSWNGAGASIALACAPSTLVPRAFLPEAYVITPGMLAVSDHEMPVWLHGLRVPQGVDVREATGGVPMLVDACRMVRDREMLHDAAFVRASERVVGHVLDEPMCLQAERARRAMVMLGRGCLGDFEGVGIRIRMDELEILAETYPLFGIDMARGTFACVPVSCDRTSEVMARAVSGDDDLAEGCIRLLVERGRLKRAGELAALVSDASRMRLFGQYPDEFADAANAGALERAQKALVLGTGVEGSLRPGLARLTVLHALAHDVPVRMLPDFVPRYVAGTSVGALRAARAVLGFWKTYAGMGERAACVADERRADGAGPLDGGSLESIVRRMGIAGLTGEGGRFDACLDELESAADFSKRSLAAGIYAAHVAVCGFLCDRAEAVLAWIEPLANAQGDPDAPSGSVSSVSDALIGTACALTRFMVEKPSMTAAATEALERVGAARRFFEERSIEPGIAVMEFAESFCMLVGGGERRACVSLARCQARWSVQGTLLGQLGVSLGMSVSDLAQDAVNQAAVHAQAAQALAQKMGLRRAVDLARLFETVSIVRGGSAPDLDRRLLEATLRQSALHPGVSVSLSLEVAILSAARDDEQTARDVFQSVGLFGRPSACRLLVTAIRALGRSKPHVLDLLPRSLRLEYESLRPASPFRRSAGIEREREKPLSPMELSHLPGRGLHLGVLGGFKVVLNGHPIAEHEWSRRKARTALLVLALFPETSVTRDLLIEALWSGGDAMVALTRNNLSTILSCLRSSLGQKGGGIEYVVCSGNLVGLNLEVVDVDVARFERLARSVLGCCATADATEILEACSAVDQLFKTGFGKEYDVMPRAVRARVDELTGLFCDCMMAGANVAIEEKDYQVALGFAQAVLRVDKSREDAVRAYDEAQTLMERQEVLALLERKALQGARGANAGATGPARRGGRRAASDARSKGARPKRGRQAKSSKRAGSVRVV